MIFSKQCPKLLLPHKLYPRLTSQEVYHFTQPHPSRQTKVKTLPSPAEITDQRLQASLVRCFSRGGLFSSTDFRLAFPLASQSRVFLRTSLSPVKEEVLRDEMYIPSNILKFQTSKRFIQHPCSTESPLTRMLCAPLYEVTVFRPRNKISILFLSLQAQKDKRISRWRKT